MSRVRTITKGRVPPVRSGSRPGPAATPGPTRPGQQGRPRNESAASVRPYAGQPAKACSSQSEYPYWVARAVPYIRM
jgi:hypothetical protein